MQDHENILQVADLQPDYMGFIFYQYSPRFVNSPTDTLSKKIKKTGVFVDASLKSIHSKIDQHQLQAVQLHGQESPDFCKLVGQLPVEVIKTFSVGPEFDFAVMTPFETVCDYFLLDTKGKFFGGNSITFDWSILQNYPAQTPFFLSGGIGLTQVDALKKILSLDIPFYAVDINSRFESKPAFKDIRLLREMKKKLHEIQN